MTANDYININFDNEQAFVLSKLKSSEMQRIKSKWHLCQSLWKRKMADRRPLNPNVVVPKPGGGTQPRDRNNDGPVRDNVQTPVNPEKNRMGSPSGATFLDSYPPHDRIEHSS